MPLKKDLNHGVHTMCASKREPHDIDSTQSKLPGRIRTLLLQEPLPHHIRLFSPCPVSHVGPDMWVSQVGPDMWADPASLLELTALQDIWGNFPTSGLETLGFGNTWVGCCFRPPTRAGRSRAVPCGQPQRKRTAPRRHAAAAVWAPAPGRRPPPRASP